MTERDRSSLRTGVAILVTALVVGPLKVPQPFLAVLIAQMLGTMPVCDPRKVALRILCAGAGALAGLFILSLAPNEQWISLPLFFGVIGWGTTRVFQQFGRACGVLFGMGCAAMFAEAFLFPARDLPFGLAHFASLATAVAANALASFLTGCPGVSPEKAAAPKESAFSISLATSAALVAASAFLPSQLTVAVGASCATALSIGGSLVEIRTKVLGGLLGVAAAFLFLAGIMDLGDAFAIYLLGLCASLAAFDWLALGYPSLAVLLRQGGAMFAVAATILPQPQLEITGSIERMAAVLLGLACGALASLVPRTTVRSGDPSRTDEA